MPDAHRHTILVVEDNDDNRDALVFLLELEGVATRGARNGREALALLQDGLRPCLIVLDLVMPDMDGLTFYRVMKADPDLASVPVVIVTASGLEAEARARAAGVEVFMRKPPDVEELKRLAAHHCS